MSYTKKPKMILFDVGGTLFDDGKCSPIDGLAALRLCADNPEITDDATLEALWNEYMGVAENKTELEIPLSAPLRFATMHTGLSFSISTARQEEIFDRYNSTRSVLDNLPELLCTLQNLGIRTAVISNNMMSGDSLALSVKHWIPSSDFEFCLSSADLLFQKPEKTIFTAAAGFARIDPKDCWYCGDSKVPDVDGSSRCGMTPVLIDQKSFLPLEMRKDGENGEYMTVNNWKVLIDHLLSL
ncbi:MAG: HAD family hydrolase [Clostridia bacterium]|nr:HAD family hydrolase [Clostridia bacterium]